MANSIGYLISLNGEYLFSSAHGGMYAPLNVNDRVAQQIQTDLGKNNPDPESCVKKMAITWHNGKFMLDVEFNEKTKCTGELTSTPSHQTKTEMCFKCLCNGKCTDTFMHNVVAKNVLPELYNTKQR